MKTEPEWHAGGPGTIWPSSGNDCHVVRVVPKDDGGSFLEYVMNWPYRANEVKYFTRDKAEAKAKQLNRR